MSTRWYPIYQRGNPQLRIFLPNFWLKLVKPETSQPESVVQFHCSMEMTKYDVLNYLTKIYNIPVAHVRTRIAMGEFKREPHKGYVIKDDDIKIAYVTLSKGQKFTYPDIYPEEKENKTIAEGEKSLEEIKTSFKKYVERNKERPGVPNWFTI